MFSSKSFIVFGLTFRSLIHFEFIFVYGVRKSSSFILLQVVDQFSQHHLLKRLSFLCCIFLHGWFLLMYDRKPQNSVKQLSINKKFKKIGIQKISILNILQMRIVSFQVQWSFLVFAYFQMYVCFLPNKLHDVWWDTKVMT